MEKEVELEELLGDSTDAPQPEAQQLVASQSQTSCHLWRPVSPIQTSRLQTGQSYLTSPSTLAIQGQNDWEDLRYRTRHLRPWLLFLICHPVNHECRPARQEIKTLVHAPGYLTES